MVLLAGRCFVKAGEGLAGNGAEPDECLQNPGWVKTCPT